MYCLFDANVIAAYYCSKTTRSTKVVENARILVESVRSGESDYFFYIPNFCIAEVFNVFMKYTFSNWNIHTKSGRINRKIHSSLRKQFREDIHNARLFYHYELSRYHVLAIDLVAPIDHHYKISRERKNKKRKAQNPAGTFDHLIIAMGIHLVKIHGSDNVVIVTADDRLAKIVEKCKEHIPVTIQNRLGLKKVSEFIGIPFSPKSFPHVINLKKATKTQLKSLFKEWPLPIKNRYRRPYLN